MSSWSIWTPFCPNKRFLLTINKCLRLDWPQNLTLPLPIHFWRRKKDFSTRRNEASASSNVTTDCSRRGRNTFCLLWNVFTFPAFLPAPAAAVAKRVRKDFFFRENGVTTKQQLFGARASERHKKHCALLAKKKKEEKYDAPLFCESEKKSVMPIFPEEKENEPRFFSFDRGMGANHRINVKWLHNSHELTLNGCVG